VVSGRDPEEEQRCEQGRLEPGADLHPSEEGPRDGFREGCACSAVATPAS
jgi:hypothetical protein